MKKIYFLLLFISLNTYANNYLETTINGKTLRVIEYEKNNSQYELKVGVSDKGDTLSDLLISNNGLSGVNGVFFCPEDYTSLCRYNPNTTNNERYVDGEKIAKYPYTDDRVVFGWDKEENTVLYQSYVINELDEYKINYGLSNRPLLLLEGVPQTYIYWDKGLILENMKTRGLRNFVCNNKDDTKKYFGFVSGVDIDELAIILKEFGCYNALNLDAGLSSGMIFNGKTIYRPRRKIIDAIYISPKNINLDEINKKSQIIFKELVYGLPNVGIEKQKEMLLKYIEVLELFRDKIEEKHRYDFSFDKGDLFDNGYKIDISSKSDLEKYYLINNVIIFINKLLSKM